MTLGMLAIWALVIAAVVWLVRAIGAPTDRLVPAHPFKRLRRPVLDTTPAAEAPAHEQPKTADGHQHHCPG